MRGYFNLIMVRVLIMLVLYSSRLELQKELFQLSCQIYCLLCMSILVSRRIYSYNITGSYRLRLDHIYSS